MAKKATAPSEYFLRVVRTLTGEPRVEDELKLESVEGKFYPFEYKGIQLFAHRSMSFKRFWTVSEKQSGLLVTKSFDTKEEAIAKAKEAIDSHSIEQVKEFVRDGAKDITPFADRKEHLT